jgi:hypothetical protein
VPGSQVSSLDTAHVLLFAAAFPSKASACTGNSGAASKRKCVTCVTALRDL